MVSEQKRILAVDDNGAMLKVVRFTLERAGFHVTTARNGREAWDLLQREDFDLVLTDYQMPEMTGETLSRRMREVERLRDVPIIILSAKGLEINLDRLLAELKIHEIVLKPFSPSGLVATVEACLDKEARVV
ncbi:MAG: hypothetical protein A2V98_04995 [Planctomycetes bacterium RBG_16_64_12]|nr:MAG: hypothetical protein A2V98_04995 [Planctomycetes bacterium RBG_16_64_12]